MIKALTKPTRLMLGVAVAAAVANAIAFAASADIAGGAPTSRLGASLQDSAARRDSTSAAEKRRLEMREQAVKASEARLAGQVRQQQEQQAAAAKSAQGGAGAPSVPYDNLARIYQTMKPNRAGPIFEKLDIEVQREVATRMRERATAQIMANMSPQGAVALSMALAGRKVVPAAGAKAGK
ncbi:MAG: magnesium transporter [Novosphingobium sp.]